MIRRGILELNWVISPLISFGWLFLISLMAIILAGDRSILNAGEMFYWLAIFPSLLVSLVTQWMFTTTNDSLKGKDELAEKASMREIWLANLKLSTLNVIYLIIVSLVFRLLYDFSEELVFIISLLLLFILLKQVLSFLLGRVAAI